MKSDEKNPSGARIAGEIIKSGLAIAASFTFSEFIASFSLLAARLPYANQIEHEDNLAASTLITTTANTAVTLALAGLYSIGIYTSKQLGELEKLKDGTVNIESSLAEINYQKQLKLIERIIRNGLILGVVTLPFAVPPLYFSEDMFKLLGQNSVVASYAHRFLQFYSLSMLPAVCRSVYEQTIFSFNKQAIAMVLSLISFGIGLGLAILLGFGYGSFPRLGFQGFAWGFITHDYLTAILFGLYLAFGREFKNFHFFKSLNFKFDQTDWQQIRNLLSIGLPTLLTITSSVGSLFADSIFAGMRDKKVLTAQTFPSMLTFTSVIPYLGMGIASSIKFSHAFGQHNYILARRIAMLGALTSAVILLPLCIAVIIEPRTLEFLISDNSALSDEVITLARKLLIFFAAGLPLEAAAYNMLQVSRATHDHFIPTLISVCSDWIGVLISYTTTFHSSLGPLGIGVGFLAGAVARFAAMCMRWYPRTQPESLQKINMTEQDKITSSIITLDVSGTNRPTKSQCWPCFFSKNSIENDTAKTSAKKGWGSWFNDIIYSKQNTEKSERTPLLANTL